MSELQYLAVLSCHVLHGAREALHLHIYMYIYIYIYVHIYVCIHDMYACAYWYYISYLLYICVETWSDIFIYVCTYVCKYACTYVCRYAGR